MMDHPFASSYIYGHYFQHALVSLSLLIMVSFLGEKKKAPFDEWSLYTQVVCYIYTMLNHLIDTICIRFGFIFQTEKNKALSD